MRSVWEEGRGANASVRDVPSLLSLLTSNFTCGELDQSTERSLINSVRWVQLPPPLSSLIAERGTRNAEEPALRNQRLRPLFRTPCSAFRVSPNLTASRRPGTERPQVQFLPRTPICLCAFRLREKLRRTGSLYLFCLRTEVHGLPAIARQRCSDVSYCF